MANAVKVTNNKIFKEGDMVWFFDVYGSTVNGKIIHIQDNHDNGAEPVCYVMHHGIKIGTALSNCWSSKKELYEAKTKRTQLQTAEYRNEITNVESLVEFLFRYDVHKNADAKAAAMDAAKALLDIEIR